MTLSRIPKSKLVFFFFIFSIILILFILQFKSPKPRPLPPVSVPTPTPTPQIFTIQSIMPGTGIQKIVLPNIAIALTFTKPINPSSVEVNIVPTIRFQTRIDDKSPNILHVVVRQNWISQRNYLITISASSMDNENLNNYKFEFKPYLGVTPSIQYAPYGI